MMNTTTFAFRRQATLDELNAMSRGTAMESLGIRFIAVGVDHLQASMPVDARTHQPMGLLHGGASVALGEMLGSWAAVIHGSTMGKVAVGVDINATHHASATSGRVRGVATAIHLGRSVTNHEVVITHIDTGKRLCTVRITNYLKPAKRS